MIWLLSSYSFRALALAPLLSSFTCRCSNFIHINLKNQAPK
uniref:Uncharacterized protein n=1 Tax=Siphoviridae sp. ctbbV81 TaxID=2827900 RepID=A0A8S5TQV0_9CAUD|nr:MAG TPA: hypothetical protein [Siphoviridae sp. ctbbV81]